MKLKQLAKDLIVKGSKEVEITGLCSDSRKVAPGNLFIAKRGSTYDGTQFIDKAVGAGASAVVTDIFDPFLNLPQVIHPNVGLIEGMLADRYYGSPCKKLFMVGVTGTKGKTTSSYLIKHLLDGIGKNCGLIGTIETIVGENRMFSSLTTPDLISNQKTLKDMVIKKCGAAVLEVSSHGLMQGRLDQIEFDLAIFTNLYPDHLDYHKTMEEYADAKRKLFAKTKKAIVNADSFWNNSALMSFGIEKGDVRATDIAFSPEGTSFKVDGSLFQISLIGKFNVYNALGAICVGLHLGMNLDAIRDILRRFTSVPGRLERIGNVFIDFAHTGEALENVLQALKEIARGRVIVVFGCGGNRDPGRRPAMGRAADKWADVSIITSDNPRQEDPAEIAGHIVSAFRETPLIELDRKKAIAMAISMARGDDLVLIAGKGHETGQIFSQSTTPFDDAAVVKEIIGL